MNFLIVTISPNSNLEEPGFPKGWLPVENSIEIWLVEVARVSRPPVVPRRNNFAKRKGGQRNVVVLVPNRLGFSLSPGPYVTQAIRK
jgi:hypothetical protein